MLVLSLRTKYQPQPAWVSTHSVTILPLGYPGCGPRTTPPGGPVATIVPGGAGLVQLVQLPSLFPPALDLKKNSSTSPACTPAGAQVALAETLAAKPEHAGLPRHHAVASVTVVLARRRSPPARIAPGKQSRWVFNPPNVLWVMSA